MSLRIGRVGIDTAASDPETWSESGDITTLSGNLFAGTLANAQTLRQQILGYVGNEWEKTVPVVWSSDTTRTGFYRVQAAKVDTGPSMVAGYVPFSMTLERVQGYAAPSMESILQGANRTNKPAGVTTKPWWAVTTAEQNLLGTIGGASSYGTRSAVGGVTMALWNLSSYSSVFVGQVLPANWYDGAATISAGGKVVVGRQVGPGHGADWQIDNGVIKAVPGSGNFVDLYCWVSGAWVGPTSFKIGYSPISTFTDLPAATSMVVLRNSPEEVSIRLATQIGAIFSDSFYVDLTLRRGSRFVSVHHSLGTQPGIGMAATTAMSHIDANLGGNVKTTNDGNGNRAVLLYATSGLTEDLVLGTMYRPGTSTFDGAIGIEVGGTGSTSSSTAVATRDQYHAAQSELSNIVAA